MGSQTLAADHGSFGNTTGFRTSLDRRRCACAAPGRERARHEAQSQLREATRDSIWPKGKPRCSLLFPAEFVLCVQSELYYSTAASLLWPL